MLREELIARLKAALPTLKARYGLESLGIFGSFARGDNAQTSDVDVAVTFPPEKRYTLMTLAGIKCDIEAAIGREIDLVVFHDHLRPGFRDSLERDLIRVA